MNARSWIALGVLLLLLVLGDISLNNGDILRAIQHGVRGTLIGLVD